MQRNQIMFQDSKNRKKKSRLARRSITCLTSNISLVCFVICYIAAGGFIFVHMESEAEKERHQSGQAVVKRSKEKFLELFRTNIENFEKNLLNHSKSLYHKIHSVLQKVDRSGIITMQSCGRASPRVDKETTRTFQELKNMSTTLNNISPGALALPEYVETNKSTNVAADNFIDEIYEGIRAGFRTNFVENRTALWTFPGAVLYSITVITTIGYGNIVPMTTNGKIATIFYGMFGIPLMILCLNNLGSFLANLFKFLYKSLMNRFDNRTLKRNVSKTSFASIQQQPNTKTLNITNNKLIGKNLLLLSSKSTSLTKISETDCDSKKRLHFTISIDTSDFMDNIHKNDEHELPMILPLLIFAIYILIGALFISISEGWIYLNSCYFVFITLSTIGFGDFVPGSLNSSWENDSKPILTALYLLFGLVLLSMCFQYIQDVLRKRARKLGKHIGLVRSPSAL